MRGITFRPEEEKDFPAIRVLVRDAFATARVADGDEQDFVEALRAGSAYIPELALVAEKNGRLVGHIMLTEIFFTAEGQKAKEQCEKRVFLLLAPLCVRLEERGRGLGAALVKNALARAEQLGYTAVFLVGDQSYYGRFGYKPVRDFGFYHSPADLPEEHVLCCELVPGALQGLKGSIGILA